jgi:hypothetical protein
VHKCSLYIRCLERGCAEKDGFALVNQASFFDVAQGKLYGTCFIHSRYPALERWAIFNRRYGARSGRDLVQRLVVMMLVFTAAFFCWRFYPEILFPIFLHIRRKLLHP